jgi:SAM-dependent MidA family methyltransferase
MDLTPGLRRIPRPDLQTVGEERRLVERIRNEIKVAGPITFARFMELALYEPGLGYYRVESARPGREGDFLTAPESHPIFGWALARQLSEVWQLLDRPGRFTIRELGAGTGALARSTLEGLRREGSPLLDAIVWQPAEIEARRETAFRAHLEEAGFGERIAAASEDPFVGLVLGNEVLDAMPVHRVVVRGGRLRELFVGWAGDRFVDVEAEPTTRALADRLADEEVELREGQHAEISLGLDAWITAAVAGLERGVLLLIDYGYPARELYDPIRRPQGTLRAYVRHTVHDDPYRHVGRQDLTAHVDVTAVGRAAQAAGLEALGVTTQAEFLAALGAGELLRSLQELPETTLQSYLEARAALGRMLDPSVTGRFRVMAFGRGLPASAALTGLSRGYGERPIARTHHGSAGSHRPG